LKGGIFLKKTKNQNQTPGHAKTRWRKGTKRFVQGTDPMTPARWMKLILQGPMNEEIGANSPPKRVGHLGKGG